MVVVIRFKFRRNIVKIGSRQFRKGCQFPVFIILLVQMAPDRRIDKRRQHQARRKGTNQKYFCPCLSIHISRFLLPA